MNQLATPTLRCKINQPLYVQVESYVRRQIREGGLQPGDRLDPNDLATQTKISRPVVQQALQSLSSQGVLIRRSRSGTYVASDAILRMDKSRTSVATHKIALIVPHIQVPEYARLAQGLSEASRAHDLDLLIAGTNDSVEVYEYAIHRRLQSEVFGLILVPPLGGMLPMSILEEIEASGLPMVCCYRRVGDERWPVVAEDGEGAGRLAVEHLVQMGHRRLGFINLNDSSPLGARFFQGFSQTIMQHLQDVDEMQELIIAEEVNIHHWNENKHLLPIIRAFIEAHPSVSGFFCVSDLLADAVHYVLKDLGRSVPRDAVVVGNGGNARAYATLSRQGITTVDYNYRQFGEEILRLLSEYRNGNRAKIYEPVFIKGELRVQG